MAANIPIHSIAKELDIDTNRIILACKSLGINAKGATKRLNEEEIKKLMNYFETGKNVSEEVIDITNSKKTVKKVERKDKEKNKIKYFSNRLIAKS